MSRRGVVRIGVSLHPKLLGEFDDMIADMGYESRSKAIHDALRDFITNNKWMREAGGSITGAVVMLYYYDKRGLLDELSEVQDRYQNVISSTMRVHVEGQKFLEILAVKGASDDVRELIQGLMTKKGVKQLRASVIAL